MKGALAASAPKKEKAAPLAAGPVPSSEPSAARAGSRALQALLSLASSVPLRQKPHVSSQHMAEVKISQPTVNSFKAHDPQWDLETGMVLIVEINKCCHCFHSFRVTRNGNILS